MIVALRKHEHIYFDIITFSKIWVVILNKPLEKELYHTPMQCRTGKICEFLHFIQYDKWNFMNSNCQHWSVSVKFQSRTCTELEVVGHHRIRRCFIIWGLQAEQDGQHLRRYFWMIILNEHFPIWSRFGGLSPNRRPRINNWWSKS